MKRGFLSLAVLLVLGVLASCSSPSQTALEQLIQNDSTLYEAGQPIVSEAVSAFNDLIPQSLLPQSASSYPLTIVRDGEETWLVSSPLRNQVCPPVCGPSGILNQPLFITIKQPSPKAWLAYLRNDNGQYRLEWYGARGSQPVSVPAQVEQLGNPDQASGKLIVKLSFIPPDKVDIIITIGNDPRNPDFRMHIVSSVPTYTLPGRSLNALLDTGTYQASFRGICCGLPKPFPPLWPPSWLQREDLAVVAMPYENPKLRGSGPIEELVGENLGFLYLRKKPLDGTTTDCGPNRVWCPPEADPFLNLKLIRGPEGGYAVQLTKLGDPNQVVATLPAQVVPNEGGNNGIGIEDDIATPDAPILEIRWGNVIIKEIQTRH